MHVLTIYCFCVNIEDMDEKYKKFKELANSRVNKALKSIRLIGNLANRQHYNYNDEDKNKIILALEGEIKSLKGKFEVSKSGKKFSI